MFPDGVVRVVGLDVTQQSIMSGAQLDALRDSGGVCTQSVRRFICTLLR